MSAQAQIIEVRCPSGPRNLLMKVRSDPEGHASVDSTTNCLEISCRDCTRKSRRQMRDAGMPTDFRVIHCFNFVGEFVESLMEKTGDAR